MDGAPRRSPFLTFMAMAFGLLAVSNATKFIQAMNQPANGELGFVLFGTLLTSTGPNLVFGLLFAAFLTAYARGIWKMRRWVMPIAVVYAFYVPTNLVLFFRLRPPGDGSILFMAGYLIVSLGGSIGTALYLCATRERLR